MDIHSTQAKAIDYEQEVVAQMPRIKAFLRNLAPDDLDDILQDTLERALRYRTAFDPERGAGPWLIRIAFRVFLDHRAAKAKSPKLLGEDVKKIPAPPSKIRENRELIASLLDGLEERDRELLVRFHCRGEQLAQIARELKSPLGTVKSLLHRARRKLARQNGWIDEK